jgi:hypothetical protein
MSGSFGTVGAAPLRLCHFEQDYSETTGLTWCKQVVEGPSVSGLTADSTTYDAEIGMPASFPGTVSHGRSTQTL